MKNKLLFIITLLFLVANVHAQTNSYRLGVKSGLNLSTGFVDDAKDFKIKEGFHIGITVDYLLTEKFILQSGLLYSQKGAKIDNLNSSDYVGGTPNYTHTFNEQYLELPIHCAYKIKASNSFNILIGAGPYLAYGIGGKTKQKLNSGVWSDGITEIKWDTFGNGVFDESRDWLHGETLKHFDFGGGVDLSAEYQNFVLIFGYDCSIINIAKKEDYKDFNYRNSNIKLSFGYKF